MSASGGVGLRIDIKAERLLAKLAERSRRSDEDARRALEAICRTMVNYIKANGPWTDRTGNLRNSIDFELDQSPNVVRATVFAGMDYAIYVELKEGYWVLSGGVEYIRPILKDLFRHQFCITGGVGR